MLVGMTVGAMRLGISVHIWTVIEHTAVGMKNSV